MQTNNVTITHMGGDTLKWGEYQVVIDGNIVNPLVLPQFCRRIYDRNEG